MTFVITVPAHRLFHYSTRGAEERKQLSGVIPRARGLRHTCKAAPEQAREQREKRFIALRWQRRAAFVRGGGGVDCRLRPPPAQAELTGPAAGPRGKQSQSSRLCPAAEMRVAINESSGTGTAAPGLHGATPSCCHPSSPRVKATRAQQKASRQITPPPVGAAISISAPPSF